MYSKGIIIGCLVRDPEQKSIGDKIICKFSVAAHNSKTDVCFMDVEAWGARAEFVMKYFKKGKPIIAEGIIKYETWEKEGRKYSKHVIVADKVNFISTPRQQEEAIDPRGDIHPSYGMISPSKAISNVKTPVEDIFGGENELPF